MKRESSPVHFVVCFWGGFHRVAGGELLPLGIASVVCRRRSGEDEDRVVEFPVGGAENM